MRVEESKDFGSRSVSKSHSFIRGDSTKAVGLKLYGVLERKEQRNAIRAIRRTKIQVPEQTILVSRVLCKYGRQERKENNGIHSEPAEGRLHVGTVGTGYDRPVYG